MGRTSHTVLNKKTHTYPHIYIVADKIADIDSISEQNSPEKFTFKRLGNSVQLFNPKLNAEADIPAVYEYIGIYRNPHERLSSNYLIILFPGEL